MDKNIQLDNEIKKLLELVQQLRKEDNEAFKEHIEQVRTSSDIQIIPFLVELLADEKVDEEKKEAILSLIMDIKHQDAPKLLVQGIAYLKGTDQLQPYLSALWQNSLSFAPYMDKFVDIALTADYLTAYDAFTVIENSCSDATVEMLDAAILKLKSGYATEDESKRPMIQELIKVLEDIKVLPKEE
ncbi:hypothetical protein [uncultured Acetobacteroides sp.]|uniref:hypothetical protein n=1 Tax=uncultured Acetobacteroides sp. TaxID=1760811 RepID=UPI0029F5967D|nr:hypothetical protein [uncultured Acetobacteroides sp.]